MDMQPKDTEALNICCCTVKVSDVSHGLGKGAGHLVDHPLENATREDTPSPRQAAQLPTSLLNEEGEDWC